MKSEKYAQKQLMVEKEKFSPVDFASNCLHVVFCIGFLHRLYKFTSEEVVIADKPPRKLPCIQFM